MPRNRLPRVMKDYSPNGRRNHDRPLNRLLDTWDRNGSTSGPTAWQIYYDDDNDDISYKWVWMAQSVLINLMVYIPLVTAQLRKNITFSFKHNIHVFRSEKQVTYFGLID